MSIVRAAHAYLDEGIEGLYDKRRKNGRRKADGAFAEEGGSFDHQVDLKMLRR